MHSTWACAFARPRIKLQRYCAALACCLYAVFLACIACAPVLLPGPASSCQVVALPFRAGLHAFITVLVPSLLKLLIFGLQAKLAKERKGEPVDPATAFDSNCITPGTPFMARLQAHLSFFIRKKILEDPAWQKPLVILSGGHSCTQASDVFVKLETSGKVAGRFDLPRFLLSYDLGR